MTAHRVPDYHVRYPRDDGSHMLSIGDRVELISEIWHRYPSCVGVITSATHHPVPVLQEFDVKLADGTAAAFSAFQLIVRTPTEAQKLVDSTAARQVSGMRGRPE